MRHFVERADRRHESRVRNSAAAQWCERAFTHRGGARGAAAPERGENEDGYGEGAGDNKARCGGAEPGAGPRPGETALAFRDGSEGETHREYEEEYDCDDGRDTGRRCPA